MKWAPEAVHEEGVCLFDGFLCYWFPCLCLLFYVVYGVGVVYGFEVFFYGFAVYRFSVYGGCCFA